MPKCSPPPRPSALMYRHAWGHDATGQGCMDGAHRATRLHIMSWPGAFSHAQSANTPYW